jgi:hypothetical protein
MMVKMVGGNGGGDGGDKEVIRKGDGLWGRSQQ